MALISLLLLAVLLLTSCQSASVNVGIINGTEAKPHSRPYMVSIQFKGHHICGGFLVSEWFVMTAAHCKDNITAWGDVTAVVGAHNLKVKDVESIAVTEHYAHENYHKITPNNDIMLLKLKKSTANSRNAAQISIPKTNAAKGHSCSVAGWGCLKTNGSRSNVLMEANVRILPSKICKEQWSFYNDATMLCGGGHNHGFCTGDSGGPLVCNDMAVGIVSFQEPNCDHPTQPNGYTRISGFLPWINKIIQSMK
ncbi:mast cell protease 8-like [Salminus brasiliensis]|uniref:mast cell protease 8-like n=1 Tax=Salminus brasiliensis TaxID=930266 RepID=UPI003B836D4F